MFKKTILKAMRNLTPEEKDEVRKALFDDTETQVTDTVNENVGDTMGEDNNLEEQKGDDEMQDENKTNQSTQQQGENEQQAQNVQQNVDNEQPQQQDMQEQQQTATIQETSDRAEGVSINDIVTKEAFEARFSAMEAKYEAVLKENKDMIEALIKENNQLKDKYENKDFGNYSSNGVQTKEKSNSANESYAEYVSRFK